MIACEDTRLLGYRFTGELKRYDNIGEFLEKIENTGKVRFEVDDHTVKVSNYS